jgi:hypothetical protein
MMDTSCRPTGSAWIGAVAVLAIGLLCSPKALASGSEREPDCRMWLTASRPELKDWAVGYLSGMNLVWNAEHKMPAEPLSMLSSREEVFTWLNAHCRTNASQPLGRALIVLFFELVKRKEGR